MARSISRPSQDYDVGTYGPFPVDNLTSADTTALEWTMTVENWPDVTPVVEVAVFWDTGGGMTWRYGGRPVDQSGPMTLIRNSVDVPVTSANGNPSKRTVSGGNITMTIFVPLRTAVTLSAI